MTQEEKQLLLKDLCARLPYGVHVHFCHTNINEKLTSIELGETINYLKENGKGNQGEVFPYLRSMTSMTEKEKEELKREFCVDIREEDNGRHTETYGYITIYHNFNDETWYIPFEAIDWLNAHHFDYRGLILAGLAFEAPEGMYKNN